MACIQFFSLCFSIKAQHIPVAEFIGPDSGLGLSYRPERLHGLASRYDNPMQELTLSPSHGSMNSATVWLLYKSGLFKPFHLVNTSYPQPLLFLWCRKNICSAGWLERKVSRFFLFIYLQIIFGPGPVRRNQRVVKISYKITLFLKTGFSESILLPGPWTIEKCWGRIGVGVCLLLNLSLRGGSPLDSLVLTMSHKHSYRSWLLRGPNMTTLHSLGRLEHYLSLDWSPTIISVLSFFTKFALKSRQSFKIWIPLAPDKQTSRFLFGSKATWRR